MKLHHTAVLTDTIEQTNALVAGKGDTLIRDKYYQSLEHSVIAVQ